MAEKKTRTVLDESNCAIFEESLEFYIHHPEMALVRFVVLDDEFIGDDFIGQYTIPFECMRAGYRHVRLLSNLGEALDNATLFVHISFSEKWAGEVNTVSIPWFQPSRCFRLYCVVCFQLLLGHIRFLIIFQCLGTQPLNSWYLKTAPISQSNQSEKSLPVHSAFKWEWNDSKSLFELDL